VLPALAVSIALQSPAPACPLDSATARAVAAKAANRPVFVFTETRERPIRRVDPFRTEWVNQNVVTGTAKPGEFFVFQIGVYALRQTGPLSARFTLPRGFAGRCISLGGIDFHGKPSEKRLAVPKGALQVLWCGIDVPASARGTCRGRVAVGYGGRSAAGVPIDLAVSGKPVPDHGAADAKSLARLRWLDSTAGEARTVIAPYTPIRVRGRTISVLGRDLVLGDDGLPAQIVSHFSGSNTRIVKAGKNVLARPFGFYVRPSGTLGRPATSRIPGGSVVFGGDGYETTWRAAGLGGGFRTETNGRLDFTGSGQIAIRVTAERDLSLEDIRLDIPYAKASATYMMGLNRQGGLRPPRHEWTWDVARHQDCFWIGAANAGLMVRLKDQNYCRPLVNIYYHFLPLRMPESWANGGKGGVEVFDQGDRVIARAYSGPRTLKKGQTLDFIADLYLTPFRPIDTHKQWTVRFVHPHASRDPKVLDDALAEADPVHGPNVVNIHQANYYNPYINYPYSPDSFPALIDYVRRAHAKGVEARVYYTTREITQNMPELYALHSLNGEIVFPGPGKDAKTLINPNGPNPWLIENLGSDFVPAWVDHVGGKYAALDISVITTPDSRWNNFYLEGLKWMVDNAKIDGVYIDDTALDASSLQRARRILAVRPNPIIDLHSWNHFNEWAGYANNLNMYMEVLPYLDRLWLGEGFDANKASWDYWLVEVSGLPFGVMSEMLDGPNEARGFVFGETGRLGWSGDPRPIWQLADRYDLKDCEMVSFFDPACPVKTDRPDVKATVYRRQGLAVVALASWADHPVVVRLAVDWKSLGLEPASTSWTRPGVAGIQDETTCSPDSSIAIQPGGGAVVILSRVKPHHAP